MQAPDRHRQQIDEPADEAVLVSQGLDRIHLEICPFFDDLKKNLRPALTIVNNFDSEGGTGPAPTGDVAVVGAAPMPPYPNLRRCRGGTCAAHE